MKSESTIRRTVNRLYDNGDIDEETVVSDLPYVIEMITGHPVSWHRKHEIPMSLASQKSEIVSWMITTDHRDVWAAMSGLKQIWIGFIRSDRMPKYTRGSTLIFTFMVNDDGTVDCGNVWVQTVEDYMGRIQDYATKITSFAAKIASDSRLASVQYSITSFGHDDTI